MNHARPASFPFETAGRMFLDSTGPHDFGIGPDRNFPEIEQARSRKTGVLRRATLIQQTSPRIAVSRAANNFDDLTSFQFNFDLRKGFGKMAGSARDNSRGIFFGDDRGHWMTEEMAIARRSGKTITRAIVVFVPVGPIDVGALGIAEMSASAPAVLPDRIPGLFVDQQVQIERIGCRTLQEMLGPKPRDLFIAKSGFWNRPALAVD